MWRYSRVLLKRNITRQFDKHQAHAEGSRWRQAMATDSRRRMTQTLVLDNLSESIDVDASSTVSAMQLWNSSCALRSQPTLRTANKVFVTGGSKAIQRIWHQYGITPNVVYVPDTEEVPSWCLDGTLSPTVVIRAPPVQINRTLLSAEMNDGFAAEFPAPIPPPIENATAQLVEGSGVKRMESVLVLYKVMIPSNVGGLCRAAADFGYDAVVLCGCADALGEKVVRASEGVLLKPGFQVFEVDGQSNEGCAAVLAQIAASHELLPIFAVPSQTAEPVFTVAKRFHELNIRREEANNSSHKRLGSMMILGSEAKGLHSLESNWTTPYQAVSIPMPNAMVNSVNVAVAGSILLQHFRPAAEEEFKKLRRIHNGELLNS